jgi:hypothetical protein
MFFIPFENWLIQIITFFLIDLLASIILILNNFYPCLLLIYSYVLDELLIVNLNYSFLLMFLILYFQIHILTFLFYFCMWYINLMYHIIIIPMFIKRWYFGLYHLSFLGLFLLYKAFYFDIFWCKTFTHKGFF